MPSSSLKWRAASSPISSNSVNYILNPLSSSDHGFTKMSWGRPEDGGRFRGDICFSPDWRVGKSKIFTFFVTSMFFFSSFKTRGQSPHEWADCWLLYLKAPKISPVKDPCPTLFVLLGWKMLSAFPETEFQIRLFEWNQQLLVQKNWRAGVIKSLIKKRSQENIWPCLLHKPVGPQLSTAGQMICFLLARSMGTDATPSQATYCCLAS